MLFRGVDATMHAMIKKEMKLFVANISRCMINSISKYFEACVECTQFFLSAAQGPTLGQ